MACYLITYDLNKETKRPPIVERIKQISHSWAKLSESSYAINHPGTPNDIYQRLEPLIDDNDQLLIIPMHQPYQGFHAKEVHEWLRTNLPYK